VHIIWYDAWSCVQNNMRHIFLAFTNPVSGNEAAYNEWYDSTHVPEVLQYGRGFIGCQRFKFHEELQPGAIRPWQYVAVYDVICEDLAALAKSPWIPGSPRLTSFHGIIDDDHVGWTFTPRVLPTGESASQRQQHSYVESRLFGWSSSAISDDSIARTALDTGPGSVACVYELAEHQRQGQQDCPWRGLASYELARTDVLPPLHSFSGAWRFSPISQYVARSEL
jgi:hypothetical protein